MKQRIALREDVRKFFESLKQIANNQTDFGIPLFPLLTREILHEVPPSAKRGDKRDFYLDYIF